jgi:hypothetical protein
MANNKPAAAKRFVRRRACNNVLLLHNTVLLMGADASLYFITHVLSPCPSRRLIAIADG